MKLSANAPCPCGSERKLKKCCALFHGGRPAPPHLLMRARYTAYAIGNVGFLIRTTHPAGPQWQEDGPAWTSELKAYCASTNFVGLTVVEHSIDPGDDNRAHVTFRAELEQDGRPVGFTERSLFLRDGARWRYHSGEMA